jgi:YD repeat-containing protein
MAHTDNGGWSILYDKMGREWGEQRTTNSITKSTTYTYNLDGSLATLSYPSGRTITYAYSGAARPLSAIDSANSINYATQGTYAPQGALAGLTLGQAGSFAGINFTASYTYRLQPNEFKASSSAGTAMDMTYNFLDASRRVAGPFGFELSFTLAHRSSGK